MSSTTIEQLLPAARELLEQTRKYIVYGRHYCNYVRDEWRPLAQMVDSGLPVPKYEDPARWDTIMAPALAYGMASLQAAVQTAEGQRTTMDEIGPMARRILADVSRETERQMSDVSTFEQRMKVFVQERDHALLSMDKATLLAYYQKWSDKQPPSDDKVFWASVHMARTGARSLPMFERAASKRWLMARNLRSMDDGEVLPPTEPAEMEKYLMRCEEFGCE